MLDFIKRYIYLAWDEIREWIYANNGTIAGYFTKLLIAALIYIVVSDYVKKGSEKLKESLNKEASDYKMNLAILGIVRFLINIIVICVIIRQMNIVEVDPIMTIAVSMAIVMVLTIQGFFSRLVKRFIKFIILLARGEEVTLPNSKEYHLPRIKRNSPSGKLYAFLLSLLYKLIGAAIAVTIVFFCYRIAGDLRYSGREEIENLARLSEYYISQNLGTTFKNDNDLVDDIPMYSEGQVTVKTDGKVNIIYLNGVKVGINTMDKDYRLFGAFVTQPEISAARKLTYSFQASTSIVKGMYSFDKPSVMFYNKDNNDCLILVINDQTNRILSITYYQNMKAVTSMLELD